MSIRIVHDEEQGLATLYQSVTDVAFGPVFYAQYGRGHSALKLAQKFIEWADLHNTRKWQFKTDGELMDTYRDFQLLDWKECDECCGDRLRPATQEACEVCLHECQECGDGGLDTIKIMQGKESGRYCGDCARKKFGNYPGMPVANIGK